MARFEDLRRSLWDNGGEAVVQPALTDQAIAEAERLLGVTLPGSLLDLLRHQNGGVVAGCRDVFPTSRPTSWSADHVPFGFVMGIGRREDTLSVLDSPYLVEEWASRRRDPGVRRRAVLHRARPPSLRPARRTRVRLARLRVPR
ncbi:SMI1/KNR4 family protein [Streptomyces sp. NBC_01007]|nr:SMI1/KNR4 family protein [Streptomyces sp. NBC_01007]